MALRQELAERTGAQPLALEPALSPAPVEELNKIRILEKLHKQFGYTANHTLGVLWRSARSTRFMPPM